MENVKGFLLLKVATHAYNNIWKHLMYAASSDIHILKSSFVFSIASLLHFLSHHSKHHRCCTGIPWAIWWWLRCSVLLLCSVLFCKSQSRRLYVFFLHTSPFLKIQLRNFRRTSPFWFTEHGSNIHKLCWRFF